MADLLNNMDREEASFERAEHPEEQERESSGRLRYGVRVLRRQITK